MQVNTEPKPTSLKAAVAVSYIYGALTLIAGLLLAFASLEILDGKMQTKLDDALIREDGGVVASQLHSFMVGSALFMLVLGVGCLLSARKLSANEAGARNLLTFALVAAILHQLTGADDALAEAIFSVVVALVALVLAWLPSSTAYLQHNGQ